MKKIITVFVLSVLLFSCSSSSAPEDTVKKFMENISKGKVDKAKEYATATTGVILDFSSQFGAFPINPYFKFELVKDSIVGNQAWVTFKDEMGDEQTLEVVKIDGDWLVNIDAQK